MTSAHRTRPLIGLPGTHRRVPGPGQPPRSAQLLPAGPHVPAAGPDVVVARDGHRRRPPRRHHRRALDRVAQGGWKGVAVVAALLALVVRGYGQVILTQPWNPYLPVLPWIVVLLAAWAVLCGDDLMLIPLVAFATLCAQTHVPYLTLAVGLVALGSARSSSARARRRRWTAPTHPPDGLGRGRRRPAVAAPGRRPAHQRAGQHPRAHRPLRLAPGGRHRPRRGRPPGAAPPRRVVGPG